MSTPPKAAIARPGVLSWTLGDRVVVPLSDGHLVASLGLVQGLPADEAARLQAESQGKQPDFPREVLRDKNLVASEQATFDSRRRALRQSAIDRLQ